jgi:hypothetical protein
LQPIVALPRLERGQQEYSTGRMASMTGTLMMLGYGAMIVAAALIVWLVIRHRHELEVENAQDVLTYFNEPHIPRWERRAFYASLFSDRRIDRGLRVHGRLKGPRVACRGTGVKSRARGQHPPSRRPM